MNPRLADLGWTPELEQQFKQRAAEGAVPARVAVEHRRTYDLLTADGEAEAALAGRVRHEAKTRRDLPAVGDWVSVTPGGDGGLGLIDRILPRHSLFTRKAAGTTAAEQIVATNIDVVFLVTSLNAELNLRRLERYLTLGWESGATPVVVLSKADLCDDLPAAIANVSEVAAGAAILPTSVISGLGIGELRTQLLPHRTGALLGSSGVGKSSLINALLGDERLATAEIRASDDKGRHTTTRRELVLVPGGGVFIDTPGMRELQITEAGHGLLSAFDDIEALAAECAFGDCTHGPEPDCAVKVAVADGRLDAARLASFHKLVRELKHRTQWEDKRAAAIAKSKVKAADRALQKRLRDKGRK